MSANKIVDPKIISWDPTFAGFDRLQRPERVCQDRCWPNWRARDGAAYLALSLSVGEEFQSTGEVGDEDTFGVGFGAAGPAVPWRP